MHWYDFVLVHRLIIKGFYKKAIIEKTNEILPLSYNPGEIVLKARNIENTDIYCREIDLPKGITLEKHQKEYDLKKAGVAIAGAEALLFYGSDIMEKYSAIDQFVYEGISKMAGQQFNSITQLSTKVESYQHDFWNGLSEPGISKLSGHIGEVYAADHLQAAGGHVQWADVSNQKGWDLLVNGHEVNIKLVSNAESLSSHFSQFPDIPVVIPGDAANIPFDAIHINSAQGLNDALNAMASGKDQLILVDNALSHDAIFQQTADATDFLTGSADIVGLHIPLITLAFSSYREIKLLTNEKTDIENSIKNIGLDVAGTGIGGFAGAKAGALAGSLLGPVGVLAGVVIGGVSGAMIGRHYADTVKEAPYKNSWARAKEAERDLLKQRKRLQDKGAMELVAYKMQQEKQLRNIASGMMLEINNEIEMIRKSRLNQETLEITDANELLQKALNELSGYYQECRRFIAGIPKWKQIVWPGKEFLAYETAQNAIRNRILFIENEFNRNSESVSVNKNNIYQLLGNSGVCKEDVVKLIHNDNEMRIKKEEELRELIDDKQKEIISARHTSLTRLLEKMTKISENINKAILPKIEEVKARFIDVKVELAKLGK